MDSTTTVFAGDTASLPTNVQEALFDAEAGIELKVTVSDLAGVSRYGFAFGGAPLPVRNRVGKFYAAKDKEVLLEWVMEGQPAGTMKVTVTRNGETVKERAASTIPAPFTRGYDAFKIKVS